MTLTVEPMINLGAQRSARSAMAGRSSPPTAASRRSGEHTVLVTHDGAEVLTRL